MNVKKRSKRTKQKHVGTASDRPGLLRLMSTRNQGTRKGVRAGIFKLSNPSSRGRKQSTLSLLFLYRLLLTQLPVKNSWGIKRGAREYMCMVVGSWARNSYPFGLLFALRIKSCESSNPLLDNAQRHCIVVEIAYARLVKGRCGFSCGFCWLPFAVR